MAIFIPPRLGVATLGASVSQVNTNELASLPATLVAVRVTVYTPSVSAEIVVSSAVSVPKVMIPGPV